MDFIQTIRIPELDPRAVIIFLCFVMAMIVILVTRTVVYSRKKKKYMTAFMESYEEHEDVIAALEAARESFRNRGAEAAAIRQAIYYLHHSIFMDYQTAFEIIEERFTGRKVRDMHDNVLAKEKSKMSRMLLLTTKN